MADHAANMIISGFVVFVFTNLGWILFRKKREETKNESDTNTHNDPCRKLLLLEQDFKNHKEVTKSNLELHERRLNAHAQDIDVVRETIARQEQNITYFTNSMEELKSEVLKIRDFLFNGKWKANE